MPEERAPHSSRMDAIRERLALCEDDIRQRPYSHPVTEGWYGEDVTWLVEQCQVALDLLARVEPELVPNYDIADELRENLGLKTTSYGSLIEDIRAVLNPASSPEDVVCKCGGKEAGDINFDRSICACGAMHYYCNRCGWPCEPCDESNEASGREDE